MNHWISLLALSALIATGPASAEVYKCRTADGRVEYANTPCPSGANTLKSVPDEKVSETNRLQAEREVERMRDYVEKREAAQRTENSAARQAAQAAPTAGSGANSGAGSNQSVDDCLRELDQQALPPVQRVQMESACRSRQPAQPVYVPVPVPAFGGNPLGRCIGEIEEQNLPPAERQRRISQCEARYAIPSQPPVASKPAPAPAKPAPTISIGCPPGDKNCPKR
jgi:hypothetical protein